MSEAEDAKAPAAPKKIEKMKQLEAKRKAMVWNKARLVPEKGAIVSRNVARKIGRMRKVPPR